MIDAIPLLLAPEGYQISRSVRTRSSASAYFNRTPASATNRTTWTWSGWIKRGSLGVGQQIFGSSIVQNETSIYLTGSDQLQFYMSVSAAVVTNLISTQVFRDPSAWYHFVVALDTTQATAANRVKVYVNGNQITAFGTATYCAQNTLGLVNSTNAHTIARDQQAASVYFDGYLTEINFIDGQALTPSSFGETNPVTGVWQPKKYTGTYGTNGFYLNFSDNSNNTAATIGKDNSGNGNNWTPNNISVTAGVTYDSMLDVPTQWPDGGNGRGNYCVLNPLDTSQNGSAGTLTNGNLTRSDSTATNTATFGTMFVSSGQWYYELLVQAISATTANLFAGIMTNNKSVFVGLRPNGTVLNCTTPDSGTYTTNDVLGVAVDIGANRVYVYKNGTLIHTLTPTTALTDFTPSIADGTGATGAVTASFNFGQQPFSYTPPTGFKALNTQNLPTPTILKGNQFFDATRYTGNGTSISSTQTISGLSFQPDFVWIKDRTNGANNSWSHYLVDAVRGINSNGSAYLASNETSAETGANSGYGITALNSDGFSLKGNGTLTNTNNDAYIAWTWKEGPTQGFDIVTYTGNGANRTIAHNLGVAPKLVIVKRRNGAVSWAVWQTALAGTEYLLLDQTQAKATAADVWNSTIPTSTVFSVGTNQATNLNTATYVAYLFSEVSQFSKAFSFTGNGSTDGVFVFTGFLPRLILLKRTDTTGNWYLWDTARNTYNVLGEELYPNLSNAAASATGLDVLSNGFKMRNSTAGFNASGGTYIGFAWAANPFKYSLGF
jgi:hypothetical protein